MKKSNPTGIILKYLIMNVIILVEFYNTNKNLNAINHVWKDER